MRIITAAFLVAISSGALAQAPVTLSEDGLTARISHLSDDPVENAFEIGMLTGLRGLERLLQQQVRYGIGEELNVLGTLPLPPSDLFERPQPAPASIWRDLYAALAADMDSTRAALGAGPPKPFELTLQDIWFDLSADGQRQATEDAAAILAPMLFSRRQLREMQENNAAAEPITVRFDEADLDWLLAYTHVLSATANFALAFDPTEIVEDLRLQREGLSNAPTIANIYDQAALKDEVAQLKGEQEAMRAESARLREIANETRNRMRVARKALDDNEDTSKTVELRANWQALQAESAAASAENREMSAKVRAIQDEIRAAESKLIAPEASANGGINLDQQFGRTADAIYVVLAALRQDPNVENIQALRAHLGAVIDHNRAFWTALNAETDNDREWIPNPTQTSALPLEFPPETGPTWLAVLDDAEHVLEGRLLLAHPLLPRGTGISIAHYFDDPSAIDLLEWIHGIAGYRYAAKGPMITQQRWAAFDRLMGGRGGLFAFMLN